MPYTNTQRPSNTRTTVTIVLSIIFGVSIIPTTALGTDHKPFYFSLENAAVPTLHQEVRVKIRKGRDSDIDLNTADKFYFIETTNVCDANPSCVAEKCTVNPPKAVTLWTVDKDTHGNYAEASVIIKSTEFIVNTAYKLCYLKKGADGASSKVREASYTLADKKRTSASFTVGGSIYTTYKMDPATVYAGQGPVTLTIAVAAERATGNKQVTQTAYLIPCTAVECTKEAFTEDDKEQMAALCSRTNKQGAVTTGVVTGFGTDTLTTTFIAPVTPADSYWVCVPYCFQDDNCGGAVSWARVDSNTPIKVKAANPLSYNIDLNSPNTLTFTGTGLKQGDKIRILAEGQVAKGLLCPSSATTMPNTVYATEVDATPTSDSNTISFTIPAEYAAAAIGQVCYSRAGNTNVWAPVFQTPKQTPLYFSLENADVPTLYQEVRVKIRRGSPNADAKFAVSDKFKATDELYFIEITKECNANPTTCVAKQCTVNTPVGVTPWTVNGVTDGNSAVATVVIKSAEFTVGNTYKMCYIRKDGDDAEASQVYEASSTLMGVDTPVSFTILSSIYTAHVTTPTTVYAGQGPVTLSITAKPISGTALGNNEITQLPYLIPCTTTDCSDKDRMASLCSTDKIDGTVKTAVVTGFGTGTLSTTFIAPVAPVTPPSYGICVPYCFKAGSCESSAVSWALVNSNTPIKILPANPSSYTYKRGSRKTLTFTGVGLKQGDKIRILAAGQVAKGLLCPDSTATEFPNSEYTSEVAAKCPTSGSRSVSKFSLKTQSATTFTGQVCYSRADTPTVWAPVSQTSKKAVLHFSLENADFPTLYQEVLVRVRRGSTDESKFVFEATDKVYFQEVSTATEGERCDPTPPRGVTLWSVKEVGTDGDYAAVSVIINGAEFTVRNTYRMCYIKKDSEYSCDEAYEALSRLNDEKETHFSFTIGSSIYTRYEMTPATVYAGQGPVTLTITVATDRAKGSNGITQRPYLIPCDECINLTFSDEDKQKMAALCSRDIASNPGAVTTGDVTGFGTVKLTTTFSVPVKPADSYGICVPYCFKTDNCEGAVSWALVDSDTSITFEAANPSSYTIKPGSPYTLTFTGTDLKQGDKIRILTAGQVAQGELCPISGTLLPNIEYPEEVTVSTTTSSIVSPTRSVSKLTLKAPLAAPVTGQVCYSRKDSPTVWAPVFQTVGRTSSDLVISPMQPTRFSVVTATPEIGKELQLTFTGTGLDAQDSSYLVTCAPEASNPQSSTAFSPDYCDDANQYKCVITKGVQSVKCKAIIDERATNSGGMRLCVCYKKNGQANYALISGSVELRPNADAPADTPAKKPDAPKTDVPSDNDSKQTPAKKEEAEKEIVPPKAHPPARENIPDFPKTDKDVGEFTPPNKPGVVGKTTIDGKDNDNDGTKIKDDKPKEPNQDGKAEKTPKKPNAPKTDVPTDNNSKSPIGGKVPPTSNVTVPPMPDVNKSTTLSATAISSAIPAVLITSVVFLYLYKY